MDIKRTSFMIKSDDLNHHGTLFAGRALFYFVEAGFITCVNSYKNPDEIVCVGLNGFKFLKPVKNGQILEFEGRVVHFGTTSITVFLKGYSPLLEEENMQGYITYVTVDSKLRTKKPHGMVLDVTEDEQEKNQRENALKILNK